MVILQATQDIGIDNYGFKHSVETLQDVKAKEEIQWSFIDRVKSTKVKLPTFKIDWTKIGKGLKELGLFSPDRANSIGSSHKPKMPGRAKRSWCGCFQPDEPPEITYCVTSQGGTLQLQYLTPIIPMPDEEEVNARFLDVIDELDLAGPKKAAMLSLPLEKKWQIYLDRTNKELDRDNETIHPEQYIERVQAISGLPYPTEDETELFKRTQLYDELKTALRSQPHSYVLRFIDNNGLVTLLEALTAMDYDVQQSSIHSALIGCFKALMNNTVGRSHVLTHPTAIQVIARGLTTGCMKTKTAVLEILAAVCLVPGGHKKVLQSLQEFQEYAGERTRFQTLINDLGRSHRSFTDEVALKTAVMCLINAVLNYGPGEESLEFRLHLRYELFNLGIEPVLDKLRKYENSTLDKHLDFFDMVRHDDERELSKRFDEMSLDLSNTSAMFEYLRKRLTHTPAYPHFMSMLQHCLLLPLDYSSHPQHWLLFDRLVQQIVLQSENGYDPDVSPLNINVKEVVHLLATEEELIAARGRAEELEKENIDIVNRLTNKEQELEARLQEKEDIENTLSRVKEKLERETRGHLEFKQKAGELEYRLNEINEQLGTERNRVQRLEHIISTGNISDDAKSVLPSPTGTLLPSIMPSSIRPPPPPHFFGNLPPPPLGIPPPLPGGPGMQLMPVKSVIKKEIPPSSAPLKSFNWTKLPDHKLSGTVWAELDEQKLYKVLDLKDFDKMFSAYQKNGMNGIDGSVEDLCLVTRTKSKSLTLIDSRRAQNCNILLTKLKMTNEEIIRVILSMDSTDKMPLDMVEQLLKFVPTPEERALLDEHSDDCESLSRADRFLYDISRVIHFEQRLSALYYKKKFPNQLNDLWPRVLAVSEASKEAIRSKRFKRVLELILAIGNYMNRGARGNAVGFKLTSLNKLADTKSGSSKQTLLHYIIETIESKLKDLLKIEEDLSHVKDAAKVNFNA
ncbi:hypothetical protein QYM36_014640 [Artemia franciscana]|uniref:Disheveled-associated activator of morphogenesis 1 n=2 Tax=Artemia franciscana TaxID=6661 RepID=A0AA88HJ70_ARTSF|nr:hypothetical protein QYM36_014640 [Artemia franciscana]